MGKGFPAQLKGEREAYLEAGLGVLFYAAIASGIVLAVRVAGDLVLQVMKRPVPEGVSSAAWGTALCVIYIGCTFFYGWLIEHALWTKGKRRFYTRRSQVLVGFYTFGVWTALAVAAAVIHMFMPALRSPAGLFPSMYAIMFGIAAIYTSEDLFATRGRTLEWYEINDNWDVLRHYYLLMEEYKERIRQHIGSRGFITKYVCAEKFGMTAYDAEQMLDMMDWLGFLFRSTDENGMVVYEEPVYRLSDKELQKKKQQEKDDEGT